MGSDCVAKGGEFVSEFKFGVIGTGTMAASMMPAFAQADVHVTAVASRDPQRALQFARNFGIPTVSKSLSSLLQIPKSMPSTLRILTRNTQLLPSQR